MRILSVNVGKSAPLTWDGQTVHSSIVKTAVAGPVQVNKLGLAGDTQTNLKVHGGALKAVYAYGKEHYAFWASELGLTTMPHGMFGENLTVAGLDESVVQVGDTFRIGTAVVLAVQPRQPCDKLAMRFQRQDMIERFLNSLRCGVYFAVLEEGVVTAGDKLEPLDRMAHGISVADIVRMKLIERDDVAGMRRAVDIEALPEKIKTLFKTRLEKMVG
ncbi:MAG: MOSC domain-containing protein [Bacteroidota bacterium]